MVKIFKKFRIVGAKPKVQKLPAQKSPTSSINESSQRLIKQYNTSKIRDAFGVGMDKRFYTKPPVVSVAKERVEKFGQLVESRALERISKIRKAASKRILARKLEYGSKANVYKPGISSKNPNVAARFPKLKSIRRTKFGKSVEEKVTTLSLQAEKLAKRKSKKAMDKFSKRLDIIVSSPKDRMKTSYKKFKPMDYREKSSFRQTQSDWGFDPDKKGSGFGNPVLRTTKRFYKTPTWKVNQQFKRLDELKKKSISKRKK